MFLSTHNYCLSFINKNEFEMNDYSKNFANINLNAVKVQKIGKKKSIFQRPCMR